MGCGRWYCAACITTVKKVKYCKDCAETVGEDLRSIQEQMEVDESSPGYIRPVVGGEKDEWEEGFQSSQMIRLSRSRLRALKRPVDVSGAVAGIGRRALAMLVDWAVTIFLMFGSYVLLTSAAGTGISAAEPNPAFVGVGVILGLAVSFLVRFVLLILTGQTIGGLLAGVCLVDLRGRPAGTFLCFGRALFDTVFDVLLPVHLLNVLLVSPKKKRGSVSDSIVGTHAVSVAEWRDKARATIYEEDRAKLIGAES